MAFYLVYKITNLIDGKYYIGKHKTNDINDGYMGSGKYIKRAIKKYGKSNFKKDILVSCDNEFDMNIIESLLVKEDDENSYNLQPGGKGGFTYINKFKLSQTDKAKINHVIGTKNRWASNEARSSQSKKMKEYFAKNGVSKYQEASLKRYSDPKARLHHSNIMKEVNTRLSKRLDAGKKIKEKWTDPNYLQKMKNRKKPVNNGLKMKEKWKDPEFREKSLSSRKKYYEKTKLDRDKKKLERKMIKQELKKNIPKKTNSEAMKNLWKNKEWRDKVLNDRKMRKIKKAQDETNKS